MLIVRRILPLLLLTSCNPGSIFNELPAASYDMPAPGLPDFAMGPPDLTPPPDMARPADLSAPADLLSPPDGGG